MSSAFPSAFPETRASAQDIALPASDAPVKLFATLGAAWVALLGYVFLRWVTADYFGPTSPGPDVPPASTIWFIRILEGGITLLALWLIWECIINPIRKDGAIGSDGLFVITWFTLWFHDP